MEDNIRKIVNQLQKENEDLKQQLHNCLNNQKSLKEDLQSNTEEFEQINEQIILSKQALEEQKLILINIIEHSNNVFYSHTADNVLIYISPQITNLLGYAPEEVLDKWTKLLSDNPINKIGEDLTRIAIETGIEQPPYELELLHKNGSRVWVEVRETPICENQQTVRIIGALIDITERKENELRIKQLNCELEQRVEERTAELNSSLNQLKDANLELQLLNDQVLKDSRKILQLNDNLLNSQDELTKALQTKDKFFSIIAHDLINPFVALINNSDFLLNYLDRLSINEQKRIIASISDASKQTLSLLENLLQWSRSQTGNLSFEPEIINLKEVINCEVNHLKTQLNNKNISIQQDVADDIMLQADRNMISTVFRNLISNAIKFTHKNGFIYISVIENGNNVMCSIKDTGIGMDKSLCDNLFRIDKKVSRPGTENESSTGLGLILCKEFVEKHQGKIWVESEEGIGSSFFFTIPKQN
jgi:PAS domain S-box-containing protein